MGLLKTGNKAPDFSLIDQNGNIFRFADNLSNRALVVYFYPRDYTPGCTAEACGFRDSYKDFEDSGALVIGISSDSVARHKAFAEKHRLPFLLLSDPGNKVRKLFGVPNGLFGLLPGRVTFVIDPEGTIKHVYQMQFRALSHVKEALQTIKALNQPVDA